MKYRIKDPPRVFFADKKEQFPIKDFGEILLAPNEQVTFKTDTGKKYDLVAKEWGFYATPSINNRLLREGFKTALVKNIAARYYIMLVEVTKLENFFEYLEKTNQELEEWLDERCS